MIAFGSDLDGMNTQNWLQPQPPRLVAVNLDPEDAGKNYRADAVPSPRSTSSASASARRTPPRRAPARGPRRGLRGRSTRALRFLDAISFALPDDAIVVATCASPATGSPASTAQHPRPHIPMGWGTLGFAVPGRARRRARRHRAHVAISGDGGFLAPAASSPRWRRSGSRSRGDRRRRRLRDAALRPGRRRRRALRRRPATPDFAAWRGVRAPRRDVEGSTTSSARRSPARARPAPSVPVGRRCSCRRRRRRRTGTARAAARGSRPSAGECAVRLDAGDIAALTRGSLGGSTMRARRVLRVPEHVRTALLALCRGCLERDGVAFVSFNAPPGPRPARAARRRALAVRDGQPIRLIEGALDAAGGLAEPSRTTGRWAGRRKAVDASDALIYHDLLAGTNADRSPAEFAAEAAAGGAALSVRRRARRRRQRRRRRGRPRGPRAGAGPPDAPGMFRQALVVRDDARGPSPIRVRR